MQKINKYTVGAAVLVALCFVLPVSAIMPTNDSSDAASSVTGQVQVTYVDSGGTVTSRTVAAFDVFQAVRDANQGSGALGYTYTTSNSSYNVYIGTAPNGYYDINPDYGKLDTFNGSSTFYAYVYAYTGVGDNMTWADAQDAIGWYRPFSDYGKKVCFYDANAQDNRGQLAGTANIVLSVNAVSTSVLNGITVQSMTNRDTTFSTSNPYMYKFYLHDATFDANGNEVQTLTGTQHHVSFSLYPVVVRASDGRSHVLTPGDVVNGYEIIGYGSDAYMALNNALKSRNMEDSQTICVITHTTPSYSYNTYYSWMNEILRTPTYSNFTYWDPPTNEHMKYSEYWYWAQYTGTVAPANYASYTLGYYSNLAGGYNDATSFGSMFSLEYTYSGYEYPAPPGP